MGKNYYLRWTAIFVLMVSVFASCQKEFDKYYELPGWMRGNAWEVLQSEGNYTIFLAGIEKSGFKELVNGKGIMTVMAPNDAAFNVYLSSKGYSSINDMPLDELKATINYHLLYYSFNQEQMANYNPWGEGGQYESEIGLYYKFRTRSQDPMEYNVPDLAVSPTAVHTVYHKERFLPVFSGRLFQNKNNIDPKYNYEYFYPGSTWTGDGGGFNVSNASVTEYAVPTDAGYVYKVSAVLEPLETIAVQLAKEPNYSLFSDSYDRFKRYAYDANNTAKYSPNDSLWIKLHVSLPPIAAEWTYNGTAENSSNTTEDYANLPVLSGYAMNAFAPNNAAMMNFFNDFWAGEYASLQEVDLLPLGLLLYNHVNYTVGTAYTGDMGLVFPESISNGSITSVLGTLVNFDPDATPLRKICVNGALYGLDHVLVPDLFNSVAGPMLKYTRFRMALQMANAAVIDADQMSTLPFLMLPSLDSDNGMGGKIMLFLPNDAMLTDNTTYNNGLLQYNPGNPYLFGTAQVDYIDGADVAKFSSNASGTVFNNHIVTADMTPNRTLAQGKVYKTAGRRGYLWAINDSIISQTVFNTMSGGGIASAPTYRKLDFPAYNGDVYELESPDASALMPAITNLFDEITNASGELRQYSGFAALLNSAGLTPDFAIGNNYIAFIPSNSAVQAGRENGTIPPLVEAGLSAEEVTARQLAMKNYVMRYFVNATTSFPIDYPFPGALDKALASPSNPTMETFATEGNVFGAPFIRLGVSDNGSNIVITDGQSNQINVTSVFPNIYVDGAAYPISGLIKLAGE